jgi:hypothetical protein
MILVSYIKHHCRQKGVAQTAGCHVRQRVAGPPALPGVRRGGARQTRIPRLVAEAGCGPNGGRGAAQSPCPPAGAVVLNSEDARSASVK